MITGELDEEMYNIFLEGDSRCTFLINSRVKKVFTEVGDIHKVNTEGTVIGSAYTEGMGCYLVRFDDDPTKITFIIEDKLEAIWDQKLFRDEQKDEGNPSTQG